jgi:hypothetical protein
VRLASIRTKLSSLKTTRTIRAISERVCRRIQSGRTPQACGLHRLPQPSRLSLRYSMTDSSSPFANHGNVEPRIQRRFNQAFSYAAPSVMIKSRSIHLRCHSDLLDVALFDQATAMRLAFGQRFNAKDIAFIDSSRTSALLKHPDPDITVRRGC